MGQVTEMKIAPSLEKAGSSVSFQVSLALAHRDCQPAALEEKLCRRQWAAEAQTMFKCLVLVPAMASASYILFLCLVFFFVS